MTQTSASDRKDVRAAEKAAKLSDRNDAEVIVSLMSTIGGRWWMWNRLTECHIYTNPFTIESLVTAFGCGEMNVGQKLQAAVLAHCPEAYIQMMREANERSTISQHAGSTDAGGRDQERDLDDPGDNTEDTGGDDASN